VNRRALYIVCGASVLFAALTLTHVVHRFFVTQWPHVTPTMWISFLLAALAALFSFVGGYLLLTGGRS
jgi:hypothetical protein